MNLPLLVAGAGIGGLGAALAVARQGHAVTVLEQAPAFGEIGAGLQLGPNAVRVLADWGLLPALREAASFPDALRVRDARSGRALGHLGLGAAAVARHGQAYACIHRADLHALLQRAVAAQAQGVSWRLGARVDAWQPGDEGVSLTLASGDRLAGPALIGCDGLWSRVRHAGFDAAPPRRTGHLAYRGLVPADALPAAMRANEIGVWLGRQLHVVHYPVRRGEAINLVAVVQGEPGAADASAWSQPAEAAELRAALGTLCTPLADWLAAVPGWTRWVLHDRDPLRGPADMARGPVALLGDAAHPMRPYLAQGAAMALEDAWTLGHLANGATPGDWATRLARYAQLRWARNARVQRRSRRNGRIFHAAGALRRGRDWAMALLGERLLDNPWLYAGPGEPPSTGRPSP
ncbi:MAG: FAD-dependent oxidoreductase [Hydrogenophaga sp.]|uniref:FAD-dependent monooxygenase n=1 Tax=Hydrogenophaga sp. TaxID=1904254 RepID=UPI0016B40B0C|nr:FAD-dependent monooxygenase [Hydrogenophaga sp.]NIM42163.1 FAD-dependent oxidoreductase [Hydrogenophaga sp.]NIN27456.1 FAD-dependent oxidoreductase [Hydrogenophaga sp.]NIN32157.1 FAD-dependent oxidoreductase [Hydrogenophaga sp.]NIN56409.1 FAD-dependent oxidoreductase [Hydrogenophaga sp.]NIO52716.1 FAD-dependent oxidoreductase [Hydrogenophaga sp.]